MVLCMRNNKLCVALNSSLYKHNSLQKQLADITNKLSNLSNSNSCAGTTTNGGGRGGRGGKFVKKEVTFNKFCSSCGVNYDHENDKCPPNKRQSWHKHQIEKGSDTNRNRKRQQRFMEDTVTKKRRKDSRGKEYSNEQCRTQRV